MNAVARREIALLAGVAGILACFKDISQIVTLRERYHEPAVC